MKIDLEVLASTDIKRRKPWPRIIWLGEEQESLLLLDAAGHRISVLYVPSGKTKKKLSKLSPLVDHIITLSHTQNGRFLLGLLASGSLFLWWKDKDVIRTIPGLQSVAPEALTDACSISASDDCMHVFVAVGTSQFFVWEMQQGESIVQERTQELRGTWHTVSVPAGMKLPSPAAAECTSSAVFFTSLAFGHCCQYSLVYNKASMLNISTLLLRFPTPVDAFQRTSGPKFTSEWSVLEYPFEQMHPTFEPLSIPGAYISCYAASGQVLAVAANQKQPSQTAMLFVSPLTDTVLVAGMQGCGTSDPNRVGKQYWVADIAWTSDSLFVACMLQNGSVCVIPRLGEPVAIQTHGCSVEMGPSHFLALHPAMMVSDNFGAPSAADQNPMQQKFSLAAHPNLPIILFSDGFLVTVVQLPDDMTCSSLMRDYVLQSAKYLRKLYQQENLDMTVADAYKLSKGQKAAKQQKKAFEFELAEITLNSTRGSEMSLLEDDMFGMDILGAIGNANSGKIMFGDPEMITFNPDATFSGLDASDALLKYLEESMSALVSTWKLAVSYSDVWTAEVDNVAKQTIHNLTKIFSLVLDCPAVEAIIPVLTPRQSATIENPRVYNVIVGYRNVIQLLRFDTFNQHLIPSVLRLVHKTINLMLTSKELDSTDPRLKTLLGCFSLLKHAESSLNRIYVWVPTEGQTVSQSVQAGTQQRFEPAVMVRAQKQSKQNGGTGQLGVKLDEQEHLPGRKLCASWKLLYKHLLQYQSQLAKSGDPHGDLEHLNKLMYSVQQTLQQSDSEITPREAQAKLTSAVLGHTWPFELLSEMDCYSDIEAAMEDFKQNREKLSVDGEHTQAVQAWKEQLRDLAESGADNPKTAKMLHAVLYTHLLRGELGQAVDFVDSLILQASIHTALSSEDIQGLDEGQRPPMMTLVTHTLRSQDSNEEELVPCIKNKSIRQTVQTMARYMAAYFSNETMFIYPPHNAQPLPSIHIGTVPTKSRIIPKYHEDVSSVIRHEELSSIWTTERTVEYLLLSGLICETAWFANKMGDWKTALLLSKAHFSHKEMAPFLYKKPKKPLQLPETLNPEWVLKEKLQGLIKSSSADKPASKSKQQKRHFLAINQETDIPQLTRTLQEILTAGIICQVELAPWLLCGLVDKLKTVVSNFPALVPQDFYLPSPPLYCPQPAQLDKTSEPAEVEMERQLRMEVSSIIQLTLAAFNAARLSLPVARWYIQELFKVQERAAQFKATTEGPCLQLPEILQQYKLFRSTITDHMQDSDVVEVMNCFRDFCSILWLLHARDELSAQLRKRGNQLSSEQPKESTGSTLGQAWVEDCFKTLKWAVQMLPFSPYLADDGCIYKVILSLVLELPSSEDTADVLAEHFYSSESLDAEVQEKLERVLSHWQSVQIVPEDDGKSAKVEEEENEEDDPEVRKSVTFYQASPRAKTLSVYYIKQCEIIPKILKKKKKCFGLYDEFVFNPNPENDNTLHSSMPSLPAQNGTSIFLGSRPFETKQSYMEFLDRFYDISFSKVVQKESEQGRTPVYAILMPFVNEIKEQEFTAFMKKYEDTFQKKRSSVVLASPRAKFFRSQSESHVHDETDPKPGTSMYGTRRGLFRSSSSGDVQPSRQSQTGMSRYESEGALQSVKSSPAKGDKQKVPSSPTRGRANMTGMASRFFQSEEVLYKDPGESQEAHWILDVNFGERYLALQQVLDWLYQWGNKQHSLGLRGKADRDLGLKPTMRIEVPTQLVVLGLWLLEHKYSPSKKRAAQKQANESQEAVSTQENKQAVRPAPKGLATLEEVTEHESFTVVTNPQQRSRSLSPYQRRSRSHSPAEKEVSRSRMLDSMRSFTSDQADTEQIHSAYQKVLHGGDDSSSLEVSSLGSDELEGELRHTLTLLRGSDGQRKGRSPRRSGNPRHKHNSPDSKNNSTLNNTLPFAASPDRAGTRNKPQTSTPVKNSPSRRSKHPEDPEQQEISHISLPPSGNQMLTAPPGGRVHNNPGHNNPSLGHTAPPGGNPGHNSQSVNGNPNVNLAGLDLAQQLQQIVRGELRRMMEVQHQSMMAMMGALDGGLPAANQIPAQSVSSVLAPRQEDNQENEGTQHRRKKSPGRKSMRGVLNELQNLQETSRDESGKSQSPTRHGTMKMSELGGPVSRDEHIELYRVTQQEGAPGSVNFVPRFLRIPAEKDTGSQPLKFPVIPRDAWTSSKENVPRDGVPDMPLLHVERTVPGHVFPKSQRQPFPYFSQPESHSQPLPYQGAAPPPPPPQLPPQGPADSPDSGIGIPLLRIAGVNDPPRRPVFGELLPPDMVMGKNQKQQEQEMLKQRYAQEFQQLQMEKMYQQEQQNFGENLLYIDFEAQKQAEKELERQMKQQLQKAKVEMKRFEPAARESAPKPVARRARRTVLPPSHTKMQEKHEKAEVLEGKDVEAGTAGELESPIEEAESAKEEAETGEDMEAESDEEVVLHDGYAIKQGEFESYLALQRELGAATDTNAKIQLLTALKLQQQRIRRKKVDFSTMTQEQADAFTEPDEYLERAGVRTSEKATSITKDTGSDPVHEAVIQYNRDRAPNVLPPDIYMGLRFNEAGQQPASDITGQPQSSRGRNYINVVDLDASAILRDIPDDSQKEEARADVTLPPAQRHLHDRIAYEEGLRQSLEPPVIERPTRSDQLTVRMFDTVAAGQDSVSIAIMPRDSMPESKAAVVQRLREMNQQLAAIDRMSNNMERDFKNTRLTLHTLDQMRAAMQPPTREEQDTILEETGASPAPGTSSLTPKPSDKSPSVTARATARSYKSVTVSLEEKQKLSADLAKVSGLSGISDIIGDMVVKGEIDLEDAGLTQAEVDSLVKRGTIRQDEQEEVRLSLDEMKRLAEKARDARRPGEGRTHEELQEWMASKRGKHMEEYKHHLQELREREVRPFKPDTRDQTFTTKALKAADGERQDVRKAKKREFMTQRLNEAQRLLGNIMTDKPELPKEPPRKAVTKTRTEKRKVSPVRKAGVKTKVPVPSYLTSGRRPAVIKTPQYQPTEYETDRRDDTFDLDLDLEADYQDENQEYDELPVSQPRGAPMKQAVRGRDASPGKPSRAQQQESPQHPRKPPAVPRLKLSLSLDNVEEEPGFQQTGETTGDLSAYARAMEAMEVMGSHDHQKEDLTRRAAQEEQEGPPKRAFKHKPFTEIVRVQRPHVTRKREPRMLDTDVYVGSLPTTDRSEAPSSRPMTQREKEMIYGSKRIPGVKKPTETEPRRVKTYTERLQEMKSKKTFDTPVAPRSHYGGSSIASVSARPSGRRPVKPKHKPMTYVEQLQKLNAGTHKPKMGKTTVIPKTLMKAHKPLHKPKTYAQQLQELQPEKPTDVPRRSQRLDGRRRPYRDPYKPLTGEEYDQWERDSVVSAWSMGDDVRQLLYDDAGSSVAAGVSMEYAGSEQVSDYYEMVMGEDYTQSVDIDEIARIADAASVSSGSMVSVIDWDAVEDLIADVQ